MSAMPADSRQPDRDVIHATRAFAQEARSTSWRHLLTDLVLLGATLGLAAMLPWWPARLVASIFGALLVVRGFILYHDYMHGAILRKSRLANAIFFVMGLLLLAPPTSWKKSHNYHHANIGKVKSMAIGSFPILSTEVWRTASSFARLKYRISRHPLTIATAYFTIFFLVICVVPFFKNPREHWDSAVSVVVHFGLAIAIGVLAGWPVLFFAYLMPIGIASALGAYLFYAQHNFVGMHVLTEEEWTYYRAALETSSFLELGPVLRWFTGNIGYHHVHHLNPAIPFYRLPEAMAAIPALQHPNVTSLRLRDVIACLRLNLWDTQLGRMVSYREARATGG